MILLLLACRPAASPACWVHAAAPREDLLLLNEPRWSSWGIEVGPGVEWVEWSSLGSGQRRLYDEGRLVGLDDLSQGLATSGARYGWGEHGVVWAETWFLNEHVETRYDYDGRGLLVASHEEGDHSASSSFAYDAQERLVEATTWSRSSCWRRRLAWEGPEVSLLLEESCGGPVELVRTVLYEDGLPVQVDSPGRVVELAWTELGRLRAAIQHHDDGRQEARTWTYGERGELRHSARMDPLGELSLVAFEHDEAGNLLGVEGVDVSYRCAP